LGLYGINHTSSNLLADLNVSLDPQRLNDWTITTAVALGYEQALGRAQVESTASLAVTSRKSVWASRPSTMLSPSRTRRCICGSRTTNFLSSGEPCTLPPRTPSGSAASKSTSFQACRFWNSIANGAPGHARDLRSIEAPPAMIAT